MQMTPESRRQYPSVTDHPAAGVAHDLAYQYQVPGRSPEEIAGFACRLYGATGLFAREVARAVLADPEVVERLAARPL